MNNEKPVSARDAARDHFARQGKTDAATTAQHTPGPWELKLGDEKLSGVSNMFGHAVLAPKENGAQAILHQSHKLADAQLIAAAPDLLAALENAIVTNYGKAALLGASDNIGWVRHARAVIAKAKGQQ